MLQDDESRHEADESIEAMGRFEAALIAAIAKRLMASEGFSVAAANAEAVRLAGEFDALRKQHEAPIGRAVEHDVAGALVLSALADARGAGSDDTKRCIADAKRRAQVVSKAVITESHTLTQHMVSSARMAYLSAANKASARVNTVGHRRAMQEAIADLAHQGISCNTYSRPNGKGGVSVVRTPVDVGIRMAVHNAGASEQMQQALEIASRTGQNLVEVSWTGNPRPSHQEWEGRVYQLSGSSLKYPNYYEACHVGDPVNGIGGYNCGHKMTIYREGCARSYGDPLEGTGYTPEEASRLTARQARIESAIRKEKRAKLALEAVGLDASECGARIRQRQAQLRAMVAGHPQVLKRRPWRETIYQRAMREAGAL